MSTTIVSRSLSDGTDLKAQVSNSQFARKHSLPTGWSRCRVGVRFQMNNVGADISGGPTMYMGLCNGSGNLFFDSSTDAFVGFYYTGQQTYSFLSNFYHNSQANNLRGVRKTGAIITEVNTVIDMNIQAESSGNANLRSAWFVDFTRNATGLISGKVPLYRNSTTSGNVTADSFYYQMLQNSPLMTNHGNSNVNHDLGDINQSITPLDHVCFGWNKIVPEIEISDLAVVHFN